MKVSTSETWPNVAATECRDTEIQISGSEWPPEVLDSLKFSSAQWLFMSISHKGTWTCFGGPRAKKHFFSTQNCQKSDALRAIKSKVAPMWF